MEPQILRARVTRVGIGAQDGLVWVEVPALGAGQEFGPLEVVTGADLATADRVFVGSVEGLPEELVVLGSPGKGGGGIEGPIAVGDVTGLAEALAALESGKATTGQVSELAAQIAGLAPKVHAHAIGDVTGLEAALAAMVPDDRLPARLRATGTGAPVVSGDDARESGFRYVDGGSASRPAGFSDYVALTGAATDAYLMQLALGFKENRLAFRGRSEGSWLPWREVSTVGHQHAAGDITGLQEAIAAASQLRASLGITSQLVSDANAALDSGWYRVPNDAANIPVAWWGSIFTVRHGGETHQRFIKEYPYWEGPELHPTWRRWRGSDGTWYPWVKEYNTEGELDFRYATKASPALTGTPTAPTAAAGTNDNQLATTKFVKDQGYAAGSHSHAFSAITGRIADAQLPSRLDWYADGSIADWNAATSNGYFMASGAANAPDGGWWIGYVVVHNDRWVTQEVWQFVGGAESGLTRRFRRQSTDNGAGGVSWYPWFRVRDTEPALDERYGNAVARGNPPKNFDDIVTAGVWHIENMADGSWANTPPFEYGWGSLVVTVQGNVITQTYYSHNGERPVATRVRWFGSWAGWRVGIALDNATGRLSEALLPPRLRGSVPEHPSDWNAVVQSGVYSADGAANAPQPGWVLMHVIAHDGSWLVQYAYIFTDFGSGGYQKTYRRNMYSGAWTAWEETIQRKVDLDVLYASAGHTHAGSTITGGVAGRFLRATSASGAEWKELLLDDLPQAWTKRSVRVATTGALGVTAATAQVLTIPSTSVLDGVTLAVGDRILVKDEPTAARNGIFTRTSATQLTRAADANDSDKLSGAVVNVESGNRYGGRLFKNTFRITDVLGTAAMPWAEVGNSAAPFAQEITLWPSQFTVGSTTAGNVGNTISFVSTGPDDVFLFSFSAVVLVATANITNFVTVALDGAAWWASDATVRAHTSAAASWATVGRTIRMTGIAAGTHTVGLRSWNNGAATTYINGPDSLLTLVRVTNGQTVTRSGWRDQKKGSTATVNVSTNWTNVPDMAITFPVESTSDVFEFTYNLDVTCTAGGIGVTQLQLNGTTDLSAYGGGGQAVQTMPTGQRQQMTRTEQITGLPVGTHTIRVQMVGVGGSYQPGSSHNIFSGKRL